MSNCDFTRCQNHILVLLCVGNAHRTGVLTHFSVADYEAGIKAASESEHVVFTVAEHKTASTHGAATVAVNRKEVSLLTGYMKLRLLPQFAAAKPFVFITATHTKMTQSNVSSALTAAFSNSGFTERVNCTKLRKSAVTQIHGTHPDKRADLASHMCHRIATAEKHYRMVEKKTNTVACTQLLRDAFTQHDHASAVDSEPITASNPNDLAQCSATAAVSQQP